MTLTTQQLAELESLARPLVRWLDEKEGKEDEREE